jgi:hypothetical protein
LLAALPSSFVTSDWLRRFEDCLMTRRRSSTGEDGVRSRYKFFGSLVFVVISVLSSAAQSSLENTVPVNGSVAPGQSQLILTASLNPIPPMAAMQDGSSSQLPDAPSKAQQNASAQTNQSDTPHGKKYQQQGAPPAAMGGALEIDNRTADKKFWGVTTAMFGASIADAELTQRCQAIGTCSFVPTSLRSRKAMYGIGIPADIGIMYLTYHMKKKHSSLWYLPSALVTGANLYVAMHAYHRANQ